MDRMHVIGVYREKRFSPGKIRQDAAILDEALGLLPSFKYRIEALQIEDLGDMTPKPDLVLSMAQSAPALDFLERWHRQGVTVINSVQSVRNCYRKALIRRLRETGIPMPLSRIVRTASLMQEVRPVSGVGCWLKRGDVHAMQSADVVNVQTKEELDRAYGHFDRQKVAEILIQDHVEGAVIKFYGVGKGAFFDARFVDSGSAVARGIEALREVAVFAAEAVGLEIYGGDAVRTPDGSMVLIDLNDWPSFSSCRPGAARGIAGYIKKYSNRGMHGSNRGYDNKC